MPILFPLHGHGFGRSQGGVPAIIFGMLPLPVSVFKITGITRDSAGAPLGNCVVELFRTIDDTVVSKTVSDASGNYSFSAGLGQQYYVVAYKAGVPDVAGTTINTLVGAL